MNWIESHLVTPTGEPIKLEPWQRAVIYNALAVRSPDAHVVGETERRRLDEIDRIIEEYAT